MQDPLSLNRLSIGPSQGVEQCCAFLLLPRRRSCPSARMRRIFEFASHQDPQVAALADRHDAIATAGFDPFAVIGLGKFLARWRSSHKIFTRLRISVLADRVLTFRQMAHQCTAFRRGLGSRCTKRSSSWRDFAKTRDAFAGKSYILSLSTIGCIHHVGTPRPRPTPLTKSHVFLLLQDCKIYHVRTWRAVVKSFCHATSFSEDSCWSLSREYHARSNLQFCNVVPENVM